MAFQPIELKAHRRSEVLSALPTRSRPHPLQHLHRVVVADGRRNTSATAASCPPPRPACHPHDLIKDPALAPRRSLHIRLGVPRRDLGSRIHRKLVFHTRQCSPLRGHSYVRHGETFAGTFRESRRYVILFFLWIAVLFVVVISWFAIIFTGRYPRGLFDFVVGVMRWTWRVQAYALLLATDKYPPFELR